jgi:type II secretory pathway pseudopilin PulG
VTLVDVLIAIAVLSLGGAGLLALQVVVIRTHALARQMTEAVTVARQQMELLVLGLSTSGGDTVDASGCSSARTCTQQGTIYTRTWTVGGGTPAQIQVQVRWQDNEGKDRQVVLDGLR